MESDLTNRRIDVARARGEMEEDLLEFVYRLWRQDAQITAKEYARENNITGKEVSGLVKSLVRKDSIIDTGIKPQSSNKILTLSTCTGSGYSKRFAVHAKRNRAVVHEKIC